MARLNDIPKMLLWHKPKIPTKNKSSYHGIKWSFHGMISSFHGMIPSFHAVFGLRQRDKSAKVIDYKDSDYLLVSFGDEDC